MAKQLILTIPAADPTLRREIEQGVEEYADVHQSQSYTDLETVKLVLDIVAQGVAIGGGVAGILTFVRSLQQAKNITVYVTGQEPIPIEQADPELLARLLTTDVSS